MYATLFTLPYTIVANSQYKDKLFIIHENLYGYFVLVLLVRFEFQINCIISS